MTGVKLTVRSTTCSNKMATQHLDLELVNEQLLRDLREGIPAVDLCDILQDIHAGEPYSAFLTLIGYAIGDKGDEYAIQFFPVLDPEDRDEYSQYLVVKRNK